MFELWNRLSPKKQAAIRSAAYSYYLQAYGLAIMFVAFALAQGKLAPLAAFWVFIKTNWWTFLVSSWIAPSVRGFQAHQNTPVGGPPAEPVPVVSAVAVGAIEDPAAPPQIGH